MCGLLLGGYCQGMKQERGKGWGSRWGVFGRQCLFLPWEVAVPLSQVTLEAIGELFPWGCPEFFVVTPKAVLGPVWGFPDLGETPSEKAAMKLT